jgi:hypothetical protein
MNGHFSARHYEGEASGPVSFLNPTTRRFAAPSKSTSRPNNQPKENGDENGSSGSVPQDEERASSVEQKWRSRDNRKGTV